MIPKFMKLIGKVSPTGDRYILDVCPFCGGLKTFNFIGTCGIWKCDKCSGGKTYQYKHLKVLLKETEAYSNIILPDPERPAGLVLPSEYREDRTRHRITTGINKLDRNLGGLVAGGMTVLTGATGHGKSTMLGQIALNAIEDGEKVCFYSGELSTGLFNEWLFSQAAGNKYLMQVTDRFGEETFVVEPEAEKHIRQWLDDRIVLYDNEVSQNINHNDILVRFEEARQYYGCTLFIADNLMSASFLEPTRDDAWHKESNFAQALLNFSNHNKVHSILVAHPRKGGTGDNIADVAGLGKITAMAWSVVSVKKIDDAEERAEIGGNAQMIITKTRERNKIGKITFNFDPISRRFIPNQGSYTSKYSWEDLW